MPGYPCPYDIRQRPACREQPFRSARSRLPVDFHFTAVPSTRATVGRGSLRRPQGCRRQGNAGAVTGGNKSSRPPGVLSPHPPPSRRQALVAPGMARAIRSTATRRHLLLPHATPVHPVNRPAPGGRRNAVYAALWMVTWFVCLNPSPDAYNHGTGEHTVHAGGTAMLQFNTFRCGRGSACLHTVGAVAARIWRAVVTVPARRCATSASNMTTAGSRPGARESKPAASPRCRDAGSRTTAVAPDERTASARQPTVMPCRFHRSPPVVWWDPFTAPVAAP